MNHSPNADRKLTVRQTYDIIKNRADLLLENSDPAIWLAGRELTDKVLPLLENTEDGSMQTTFDKKEMSIVLTALREMVAQPSEYPIVHTPEFNALLTKVYKAAPGDEGARY